MATTTSAFGVGRREGHDASAFYERFSAPTVSDDAAVCHPDDRAPVDVIHTGDVRELPGTLAPRSVALVVTSPPYYSGKAYELAVGEGHVPASYRDYLAMLEGVLGACADALEPGGRMAVNVANLGRKPYRSLAADVIHLLEELGLLLRGEVIWQKARAAGGNCAWGTFQRPGDPVLRDLTERVIIASKGRFDRAQRAGARAATGLPSVATITRDEFLEATVDVWELPTESATRIGHPAPFPVELPQRLIELYTYEGDLVVDPFMGSGTTAVAALRTGRHWVGYDTTPEYVTAARSRIAAESAPDRSVQVTPGRIPPASSLDELFVSGRRATEVAAWALENAGFLDVRTKVRLEAGIEVGFTAVDAAGTPYVFDVVGGFTTSRSGLARADLLARAVGKAAIVAGLRPGTRVVLLAPDVPAPRSPAGAQLAAVTGPVGPVFAVFGLGADGDLARLADLAGGGATSR